MLTHFAWPFHCLFLKVSSQFIVVLIIFSTADNCFGLLVHISTERKTILFFKVSSQFIVVLIIFSTADNFFGLLVLISTVRETKNYLKS